MTRQPAKRGILILSGGGRTSPDCTKALIKRAGGNDAPIVVLGQASDDPKASGERSAEWLRENGAKNVLVPSVHERADVAGIAQVVEMLKTAGGVWMGGGDQSRFMQVFDGTAVPNAVREVLARYGAAGGTSAGASLAGSWMPTGEGDKTKLVQNSVETKPALALFANSIVDSHFLARERVQRLLCMVLSRPPCVGIGIDEGAWAEIELPAAGRPATTAKLTARDGQVVLLLSAPKPAAVRRDPQNRLAGNDLRLTVLLPNESAILKHL